MTRVITSKCVGTKAAECVTVCPVDCIHPRPDEADFVAVKQLYINPNECIDCGACEDACPVNAIFPADTVPVDEQKSIARNAHHFAA